MKKLVLPFVLLSALCACHTKPELRKDIKEFISQFSLNAAMEQYVTGGYTSTKVTATTKEVISLEFSRVDAEHPTYKETTTIYENDVETSKVEVEVVENEDGLFLSTNGELQATTLKKVNNLITKFFYKQVDLDGTYHTQGCYYGDYLKEVAPVLQKYVTIDQEQELYIYEYEATVNNVECHQKYLVNKWGMLVENHVTSKNNTQTDIYVHN